jgi:hypothetical protein
MRPNQFPQEVRRASISGFGLTLLSLLATMALAGTARAQAPVPLGTADTFAVLAGTTVTNTGPTVINGNLGVSPGTAIVGFPPGVVNGTTHSADAVAAQAQLDLTTAYNNAAGQPVTATIGTELGGQTLGPGVYDSAAGDFEITGTLTLDGQGNPNAIFIFKTASTLVTAAGNSQVDLVNGAQSCNVFWQVGSSATLGTNTLFRGNILALTSITATTGAIVDGRLLARNGATTLDTNTVTLAACAAAAPPPLPPAAPGVTVSRPAVTITRVPKRCVARNFKLRVKVSFPGGIGSTNVFLDGRRIKRSSKTSFTVKVGAKGLKSGRHRIRVVATDAAGNQRVRKASFGRCGRARINFTG